MHVLVELFLGVAVFCLMMNALGQVSMRDAFLPLGLMFLTVAFLVAQH